MSAPVLEIGRRADGRPLVLPLGWHTLVAGLSGSGKSTTLRAALTVAAPLRDLAIVLIDPKRVEARPWRSRAARVAVTTSEILDVLRQAVDAMEGRYELVDRAGAVEWDTRFGPRVLLVVDELAGVIATGAKAHDREAATLLRLLLERGRACGYTLVLATQRPSADVIPTTLRDLTALRIAHATANEASTKLILADAADTGPAHRLRLDDRHRGQSYAMVDGERSAVLARSYFVTVAQAEQVARRRAHLNAQPWPAPAPVDTRAPRAGALVGAGLRSSLNPAGLEPIMAPATQPALPLPGIGADADETAVLSALAGRTAPVATAELPGLCGLSEGRTRRARDRLAAGRLRRTTTGWLLP